MASLSPGRRGRAKSSPPQFGHAPRNTSEAQVAQKVHSKEQMRASVLSGGSILPQHSQLGRNCSMALPHKSMVRARTLDPVILNSPMEMGKLKRRGPQLPGFR